MDVQQLLCEIVNDYILCYTLESFSWILYIPIFFFKNNKEKSANFSVHLPKHAHFRVQMVYTFALDYGEVNTLSWLV